VNKWKLAVVRNWNWRNVRISRSSRPCQWSTWLERMTINSNQVNSTRLEVELKFKLRCFIRALCDSHNMKCPTAVQTSGQIWNLLCFICCWKSRVMYLLHLLWLSMYSAMAMVGIPCDQCPHCSHLDMLILQILFTIDCWCHQTAFTDFGSLKQLY